MYTYVSEWVSEWHMKKQNRNGWNVIFKHGIQVYQAIKWREYNVTIDSAIAYLKHSFHVEGDQIVFVKVEYSETDSKYDFETLKHVYVNV